MYLAFNGIFYVQSTFPTDFIWHCESSKAHKRWEPHVSVTAKPFDSQLKDWFQWGADDDDPGSLSDITVSWLSVTMAYMEVIMPSDEKE